MNHVFRRFFYCTLQPRSVGQSILAAAGFQPASRWGRRFACPRSATREAGRGESRSTLLLLAILSSLTLFAQTSPQGSLHGVVRDTVTGAPLAGVVVSAGAVSTVSDAQGNYSLRELPPGEIRLAVTGGMAKNTAARRVELGAGRDLAIDLAVQAQARISGAVLDSDGKPVSGATVMLVTREYSLGALRYVPFYGGFTNDRGEYGVSSGSLPFMAVGGDAAMSASLGQALQGLSGAPGSNRNQPLPAAVPAGIPVEAGRGYLLVANKGKPMLRPPAEEEASPAAPGSVPQTTWYIGSRSPDGALPILLSPGERRERVDMKMAGAHSYCILGTAQAGEAAGGFLQIDFAEAPLATGGVGGAVRFQTPLEKQPGKNAKIRLCGLVPGEYRLGAWQAAQPNDFPIVYSTQVVTISDKDVQISFDGPPPVRIAGEVVWDGVLPGGAKGGDVQVQLRPLARPAFRDETLSVQAAPGGPFALDRLVADEYEVQVNSLPPGAYLKDVTYGGQSILHAPLRAGSANLLRVVLARDGGRIAAQVADGDGNPVPDAWVVAMPAAAGSEAALADSMMWGRSNDSGVWNGPLLAPGKYLVLASLAPVDCSFEAVGRLYAARGSAQEVDVGPGATVPVKLSPTRPR